MLCVMHGNCVTCDVHIPILFSFCNERYKLITILLFLKQIVRKKSERIDLSFMEQDAMKYSEDYRIPS